MACKVWIWNYQGTKTAFGHASMSVYRGEPYGTTYVSWGPNCGPASDAGTYEQKRREYFGMCEPQRSRKLSTDIESEFGHRPDKSVWLDGLDETAIKAFWFELTNDYRAKWSASTVNCACAVKAALKAGGSDKYFDFIDELSFDVFHTNWFSLTPESIYQYAEELHDKLRDAGLMP